MKKIPKKYWKMAFNRWYCRLKGVKSSAKCGYCEYFIYEGTPPKTTGCNDCTINHITNGCFNNGSLYRKWQEGDMNAGYKIFTAIVADGRRLGYVGDNEEIKIKEVVG